mmetsp:Transcript_20088/g.60012  ORF Transcript_20088/g.60012 Transcript_20088/m.60012 type:complete len:358 (-) Transcript_20088:155-1228(-)
MAVVSNVARSNDENASSSPPCVAIKCSSSALAPASRYVFKRCRSHVLTKYEIEASSFVHGMASTAPRPRRCTTAMATSLPSSLDVATAAAALSEISTAFASCSMPQPPAPGEPSVWPDSFSTVVRNSRAIPSRRSKTWSLIDRASAAADLSPTGCVPSTQFVVVPAASRSCAADACRSWPSSGEPSAPKHTTVDDPSASAARMSLMTPSSVRSLRIMSGRGRTMRARSCGRSWSALRSTAAMTSGIALGDTRFARSSWSNSRVPASKGMPRDPSRPGTQTVPSASFFVFSWRSRSAAASRSARAVSASARTFARRSAPASSFKRACSARCFSPAAAAARRSSWRHRALFTASRPFFA